jgi:hypothetical protein
LKRRAAGGSLRDRRDEGVARTGSSRKRLKVKVQKNARNGKKMEENGKKE